MLVLFRMVKSGYAKSVSDAAEMDARTVIQALVYDDFLSDYEAAYMELNK